MAVNLSRNTSIKANFNVDTKIILSLGRNPQGMTDEAMTTRLGHDLGEIRAAVKRLLRKKLIFNSGEVRKTTRGMGTVYTRKPGPPGSAKLRTRVSWRG